MERRENTVLPGSSNMVGLRGVPRLIVRPLARGAGEEAFGCSERWGEKMLVLWYEFFACFLSSNGLFLVSWLIGRVVGK